MAFKINQLEFEASSDGTFSLVILRISKTLNKKNKEELERNGTKEEKRACHLGFLKW